jgi:hypothetical protein
VLTYQSNKMLNSNDSASPVENEMKFNKIPFQLLTTAGVITLATVGAAPVVRADLTTAKKTVDDGMTMLTGIADTGVGIVIVPFSISFALTIAGHILRHA